MIADQLRRERADITTGIAACLSPWAFVLSPNGFWSAFWLHALTGPLRQGGTYTPALSLINDNVERGRGRGRAMGFPIAGSSAGYAICLGIAGLAPAVYRACGACWSVVAWPAAGTADYRRPGRGGDGSDKVNVRARRANRCWARWLRYGETARARFRSGAQRFTTRELLGIWAWLPAFLTAALLLLGASPENALLFCCAHRRRG